MANTYTQIYIHVVFAVEGRQNLIDPAHNDELQKYITGIVTGQEQKLIVINNMPDHLHLLVGLKPDLALSDLVRDIKANSAGFINRKRWVRGRFGWQEGFGAFSYSRSQLDTVARYIQNQQAHHATRTFREEYLVLLEEVSGGIRRTLSVRLLRVKEDAAPLGLRFFGLVFSTNISLLWSLGTDPLNALPRGAISL